jgi:two-component system response regulator YesN
VFIIESLKNGIDFSTDLYKKLASLQKLIKSCFDLDICIAVSLAGEGWQQLPEKTQECLEAIEYKFYMGNNAMILCEDMHQLMDEVDFSVPDKCSHELVAAIKLGDEQKTVSLLEELNSFFTQHLSQNVITVRNYYIKIIYELDYLILMNNAESQQDLIQLHQQIKQSQRITDFQQILNELALELVRSANTRQRANISIIIKRAIAYIEKNYYKQLTLEEVADNAIASIYYLCHMFKKETGRTFVEFLYEIRMEQAKKLLKNTLLKIYEIAERTGINDAQYFSKLFKKYTGQTPSEFRNLN